MTGLNSVFSALPERFSRGGVRGKVSTRAPTVKPSARSWSELVS